MRETEKINPKSKGINNLNIDEMVNLIVNESFHAFEAVKNASDEISKLINVITNHIIDGGKVIYLGAGTSGRIAAQDVIELFPTYSIGHDMFDYIMTGGKKALYTAVESSEDNKIQAIIDLKRKIHSKHDVIIGISASGETPYVIESLKYAIENGYQTAGITNNQNSSMEKYCKNIIVLNTGAEVIQGSTRMNAGTAQKITLNTISTAIAVILGRTYDNTMSSMKSNFNQKLRIRAENILMSQFNIDYDTTKSLLEKHGYDISLCIEEIKKNNSNIT